MKSSRKDFLKILSSYQGIIHKVKLLYFKTKTDREDNFQEVVYRLWKSFSTLRDSSEIASWIYAVAINTSIIKIRKDSRIVSTSSVPDTAQEGSAEKIEHDMNSQQLLSAMEQLNKIDRSIMPLYLEERNYDEIATIIGIDKVNVGVRIAMAKNS
ncbi:MAG: sigma-70 family RNA polymerase sigma factor [Prevotellaceae bacterium]|jgi:RNA polymerase sigma-70 factor (ECF subfamily)|nr:sigma-70 family RNA polymerase sigma factor [Prevotellaceae bacterium]